jgi:hypothetical protein
MEIEGGVEEEVKRVAEEEEEEGRKQKMSLLFGDMVKKK